MYVEEEEYKDQSEINAERIDDNRGSIIQNRIALASLCFLVVFLAGLLFVRVEHNIEDCEKKLYEHITKGVYDVAKTTN